MEQKGEERDKRGDEDSRGRRCDWYLRFCRRRIVNGRAAMMARLKKDSGWRIVIATVVDDSGGKYITEITTLH